MAYSPNENSPLVSIALLAVAGIGLAVMAAFAVSFRPDVFDIHIGLPMVSVGLTMPRLVAMHTAGLRTQMAALVSSVFLVSSCFADLIEIYADDYSRTAFVICAFSLTWASLLFFSGEAIRSDIASD